MYRSAFVLLLLTAARALATTPEASEPTRGDLHAMDERVEAIVAQWHKTVEENAPVRQRDAVELWVQPLGSILYGSIPSGTQSVYVSAGVTVPLPQWWELVLEGALQWVPTSYYGDGYGSATVWQLWLSLAVVRFFHAGRPYDGFFVGPKLEFTSQQVGPCFGTTGPPSSDSECPYGAFPPNAGGALTITCEAGYRFQFGHFVLSLIFPSVGLGYGWNDGTFVYPDVRLSPNAPGEAEPRSGFALSLDFNTLRLGVSF